jgi:aminopeptidase N
MPGMNLTASEAAERAALVSKVSYSTYWNFALPGDTFRNRTVVIFDSPVGAQTFVDMVAHSVQSVTLNDRELDPAEVVREGRVHLTGLSSTNRLIVDATYAYRNDGQGIHRFVDPESGETYLYSQFAANDARSAFVNFDQPDIKATFAITVDAPAHWAVVSNSLTPQPTPVVGASTAVGPQGEQGVHRWSFPPTVSLPSYVAAVIAGPYAWAEGTLTSRKGTLPARVYGRANLADHLDAEEMIGIAQAGLELYESVFDVDYPYTKYDQIFVPEYNLGAMENVGCVTFSEDRLLFRSRPSDAMRELRTNIVLHELSHMWFGNLVTMRWWDDLWLNESFAEFMGAWATSRTSRWTDSWVTFTAERKSIAYVQDQLPTTHPIVAEVPDTKATVSAFDMITYAKGASALKQLVAFVGEATFFSGVSAYLKRYGYGNATLAEFLHELEQASGLKLTDWSDRWLQTPGPSTLRPVIEDADGAITALTIDQHVPADFPVHRPHRVTVAGYSHTDGAFERDWAVEANLDGASTGIPQAAGKRRPDLLLINDGDLTYAKVELDEKSLATLSAHLGDLTDAMALGLVLDALWQMARDARLPAERYIDAVLTALPSVTNSETAAAHLRNVVTALTRYVPPAQRAAVATVTAERLWSTVADAPAGSDLQLQTMRGYARLAATPAQAGRLAALMDASLVLDGLVIDTDLGWELTTGMVACDAAGEAEISALLQSDYGAIGMRRAAGARAVVNTTEAKRGAWESLVHPSGTPLPNAVQYEVALGFARTTDPATLAPLAHAMVEQMLDYYLANEGFVGARVVRYVFPTWAAGRVEGVDRMLESWLAHHPDAPSVLRKVVIEGLDEVRRSLAAQAR